MRPSSTLCVETFGRDLRDNNKADGPAHQPDLLLIRFFLAGPGDGQTFRVEKEKFKVARLLLLEFNFKTTVLKPDRKKRMRFVGHRQDIVQFGRHASCR